LAVELLDRARRDKRGAPEATGISTVIIAERHRAGDSVEDLAEDYKLTPELIEDAIRFESRRTREQPSDAR
jgi:uncharacterized protein (DUF433 family)